MTISLNLLIHLLCVVYNNNGGGGLVVDVQLMITVQTTGFGTFKVVMSAFARQMAELETILGAQISEIYGEPISTTIGTPRCGPGARSLAFKDVVIAQLGTQDHISWLKLLKEYQGLKAPYF